MAKGYTNMQPAILVQYVIQHHIKYQPFNFKIEPAPEQAVSEATSVAARPSRRTHVRSLRENFRRARTSFVYQLIYLIRHRIIKHCECIL